MKTYSMRSIFSLCALAMLVSACGASTGALYQDAHQQYEPVENEQARLVLYREDAFSGSAIQPSVRLDGEKIRDSVPNSYTVKDIAAGPHVITVATEVEKRHEFVAKSKEVIFIREASGFGWLVGRIHLEPVSKEIGEKEIQLLHEQIWLPKKAPKE